jgi:hypothetical protein
VDEYLFSELGVLGIALWLLWLWWLANELRLLCDRSAVDKMNGWGTVGPFGVAATADPGEESFFFGAPDDALVKFDFNDINDRFFCAGFAADI